jgi:hypothetical protein
VNTRRRSVESGDSVSARRHSVSVLETLGELSEEGSVAGPCAGWRTEVLRAQFAKQRAPEGSGVL